MGLLCALLVPLALALLRGTSANLFQPSKCLVPMDNASYHGPVCNMKSSEASSAHPKCDRTGRPSAVYWNESTDWLASNANYTIYTDKTLVTFRCEGDQCHDGGSDMWVYKNDVMMDVFPATYVLSGTISQSGFDKGTDVIVPQSMLMIWMDTKQAGKNIRNDVMPTVARPSRAVSSDIPSLKACTAEYVMVWTLVCHIEALRLTCMLPVHNDETGSGIIAWRSFDHKITVAYHHSGNFETDDSKIQIYAIDKEGIGIYKQETTCRHKNASHASLRVYVDTIGGRVLAVSDHCRRSWQLRKDRNFMQNDVDMSSIGLEVARITHADFTDLKIEGCDTPSYLESIFIALIAVTAVATLVAAWFIGMQPWKGTKKADQISAVVCGMNLVSDVTTVVTFALLPKQGTDAMHPSFQLWLIALLFVLPVVFFNALALFYHRIADLAWPNGQIERYRTWVITALFNAELLRLYLSALESKGNMGASQLKKWKSVLDISAAVQCVGMLALTSWVLYDIPPFCISAFKVLIFSLIMSVIDLLVRPVARVASDLCGCTCSEKPTQPEPPKPSTTNQYKHLMYGYHVEASSYEELLSEAARSGKDVTGKGYHDVDQPGNKVTYKLSYDTLRLRKEVQCDWEEHRARKARSMPDEAALQYVRTAEAIVTRSNTSNAIIDYFETRVEHHPMAKMLGVLVFPPGPDLVGQHQADVILDDAASVAQQNTNLDDDNSGGKRGHMLQHDATHTHLYALNEKITNLTGILVHRFVTLDGPSLVMMNPEQTDESWFGVLGVQFKGRIYTLWLVCPVCGENAECGPQKKGFKLAVIEDTSLVPQIMQAASFLGNYMKFLPVDLNSLRSALVQTVEETSHLAKDLSTVVEPGKPTEVNRKFLRGLLDKLDGAWAMLGLKEVVHAASHQKEYVCHRCAPLYEVLGDEARAFVAQRRPANPPTSNVDGTSAAHNAVVQVDHNGGNAVQMS